MRALRGPNYWRLAPVISCELALGALAGVPSTALPGFVERLREGTHLPHILEHVALELQTLAGSDVSFGRVVPSGDEGVWWVIVAYEEEAVGVESMHEAARVVRGCLVDEAIDTDVMVHDLQRLYETVRLGPSTGAIVEEARRRGIPVRRLNNRSLVQLGLGRNLRRIQATVTDRTSSIAVEIAQDKDETKRVLGNIGLPVPRGDVVRTLEDAIELAEDIGFPVIVKPLDASHGRGISRRIDDVGALRHAFDAAQEFSRRVVIEQFASGNDHRVLVVNGKVVAAAAISHAVTLSGCMSSVRSIDVPPVERFAVWRRNASSPSSRMLSSERSCDAR